MESYAAVVAHLSQVGTLPRLGDAFSLLPSAGQGSQVTARELERSTLEDDIQPSSTNSTTLVRS